MTSAVFSAAKNLAWLSVILVMSLIIGGCGGSGGSGGGGPSAGIGMDDLGEWSVISQGSIAVGFEHTEYALRAQFDADGSNPTITASSPMHQPTVAGTWSGKWSGRYSLNDYLDGQDSGNARINVTIAGDDVFATLVYSDIDIQGVASSISFARASVTNGRFAPRATVSVPTETGGRVSRTYSGFGQFGGSEQQGVVGYVSGTDFRSAFYGDRVP